MSNTIIFDASKIAQSFRDQSYFLSQKLHSAVAAQFNKAINYDSEQEYVDLEYDSDSLEDSSISSESSSDL